MQKIVNQNFIKRTASVEAPMSSFYKDFMNSVELKSNSTTDKFLAGVQCIIWGSLYIEAVVNYVAARLFSDDNHPNSKARRAIWQLAERADLEKKVLALANSSKDDSATYDIQSKKLARLIRLRNRLVHYKDPPTPVDVSFMEKDTLEVMGLEEMPVEGISFGQLQQRINDLLPNPDIIGSVLSMSLDVRRSEIIEIGEWISSLSFVK